MSSPNELTATAALGQIQAGALTAEAYVRACLDRIAARDQDVHAWAHLDPERALAAARAADRSMAPGSMRGIPVGVKDVFATRDMPTEYGSPIYKGHRPAMDAACVAAVRAAGAIILGKTVTTEFATFFPGKTRNPNALGHTPGGSSSGSAAAVADCMVPLAFATQTAGSTIRPASYCGIVGFKPSFGTISRAGLALTGEATLDTVATYARSISDIALFTEAAARQPPGSLHQSLEGPLSVGLYRPTEWDQVDARYVAQIEDAAQRLARAGHRVADIAPPPALTGIANAQWTVMLYEFGRALTPERREHGDLLSDRLRAAIDEGLAIAPERYVDALRLAEAARAAMDSLFERHDVLITAAATGEAPAGLDPTGNPIMNRPWTILHTPCLTLPLFKGPQGLPIGLQLVGKRWLDRKLLAAARCIARDLGADNLV